MKFYQNPQMWLGAGLKVVITTLQSALQPVRLYILQFTPRIDMPSAELLRLGWNLDLQTHTVTFFTSLYANQNY